MSGEGLQGLFIRGLETNAASLFLISFGCFPNVCTDAVCGVYVRIFPSIDLHFCSNVFGSFTFVDSLKFFLLPGYTLFSCSCRVLVCTRFCLTFSLTLAIFYNFGAPVFLLWRRNSLLKILWQLWFRFDFFLLMTLCLPITKSCIFSTGNDSFVKFFISKQAGFAFAQFKLLDELLVATFERGVFGFRRMCASNGEICVTPCDSQCDSQCPKNFGTSEASLYGVFV